LVALGLVAVANLIRPQALVLLLAVPTAACLHILQSSRRSGRMPIREVLGAARPYLLVLGVLPAGLLGLVLVWLWGGDLTTMLGPNATYYGLSSPGGVLALLPQRALLHLAELDLFLGILPFAALLGLWAPSSRPRASVFLVVASTLTLWTVVSVGAFTSYVGQDRIEERNTFFVAPFFFVALLRWVQDRPPWSWWCAACCAISGALPWAIPFESQALERIVSDTLALVAAMGASEALGIRESLGPAILALSLLGGASLLVLRRRLSVLAPALVLGHLALANVLVHRATASYSEAVLAEGVPPERVDWIDRAVGAGARVSAIWHGGPEKLALWQSEFFNRSVSEVYRLYAPRLDRLRADALRVDPTSGELLDEQGSPVHFDYLLAHTSLVLDAATIASDPPRSMALYAARGPVRVRTMTKGIYADGWSEPQFEFTAVGCLPGLLFLDLYCNPSLFSAPQAVAVDVSGVGRAAHSVQPGERRKLVVPLPRTLSGPCRASFEVSPTVIPAEELGMSEGRRLGIYCERLVYEEHGSGAMVVASGFDRDGWSGAHFRLDVLGNTGGTLTLQLEAAEDAEEATRMVVARVRKEEVGRVQLAPGEVRPMTIPVPHWPGGLLSLDFEVAPARLRCTTFLYVDGPEEIRTVTEGIHPDGSTEGTFRFTAFAAHPGSLTLWLDSSAGVGTRTVVAFAGGRELSRVDMPPGVEAWLSLPRIQSEGGAARVEFRVIATDTGAPVAERSGIRCRGLAYGRSGD
jgi:hypothetical protein